MKFSNQFAIAKLVAFYLILQFNLVHCRWYFQEIVATLNNEPMCYGDLGCFNRSEVSSELLGDALKLGAQFPEPPEKNDIQFRVFSCQDRYNPSMLDWKTKESEMNNLNFDPKNRTIVLIHGYTDNYDQFNWMGDLKDHILRRKDCNLNVAVVDWRGGSKVPNYLTAVANTQMVGAVVARFITRMNKVYGMTNDHWTIVGHSLGGQSAGFVGKRLQNPRRLRLIIGLDPAGPAYTNVSLRSRLNPNDADLVISIHTNGGEHVADGLGILTPSGHYSFFVNGGEIQPGCGPAQSVMKILTNGLAEGLNDVTACSHRRAYDLVTYEEKKFDDFESMAYQCKNYKQYTDGRCAKCRDGSDDCKPFGRWWDWWQGQTVSRDWLAPISYYIDTRDKRPYSYFFYQIKVITGDGFQPMETRLLLNITGSLRRDFIEKVEIDKQFEPNKEFTYLHKSFKTLGRIEKIDAILTVVGSKSTTKKVTEAIRDLIPTNRRKQQDSEITIKEIQVNYMNGYTENKRRSRSAILRPENQQSITKNDWSQFRAVNSGSGSGSGNRNRKPSGGSGNDGIRDQDSNRDRDQSPNRGNQDRDQSPNRGNQNNRDRNPSGGNNSDSDRNRDRNPSGGSNNNSNRDRNPSGSSNNGDRNNNNSDRNRDRSPSSNNQNTDRNRGRPRTEESQDQPQVFNQNQPNL